MALLDLPLELFEIIMRNVYDAYHNVEDGFVQLARLRLVHCKSARRLWQDPTNRQRHSVPRSASS